MSTESFACHRNVIGEMMTKVELALLALTEKPAYSLRYPVVRFCRVKRTPEQLADFRTVVQGTGRRSLGFRLRIVVLPSRPKKSEFKRLLRDNGVLTLLLYIRDTFHTVKRKVAECLKLGLDRNHRLGCLRSAASAACV